MAVALGLVTVAVPLAGPVWEWAMLKQVERESGDEDARTYETVSRWTGRPPKDAELITSYYVRSGFRKMVMQHTLGEDYVRHTQWNADGTVMSQSRLVGHATVIEEIRTPPWWWDVSDQTEPTAP